LDGGSGDQPRTKEVFELLDDPLQKANHWIRGGARLLGIAPENPSACKLWISIFGLDPEDWPAEGLYPLALLLPSLQGLAGTERGIRLALDLLLHLPLAEIRFHPDSHSMERDELSLLGMRASRLGTDYVLGNSLEDVSSTELILGPVGLRTYYEFQSTGMKELLHRTLRLVVPCYTRYDVFWVVDGQDRAPRLVTQQHGLRLGINSYLRFQRSLTADLDGERLPGAIGKQNG
jgi:predicted component of type VI protein secretion system